MKAIELLYRAALEIRSERILVINAQAHPLLLTIKEQCSHLDIQQHFKPEFAAIEHIGLSVSPHWPDSGNMYDLILLKPSKNKQQTQAWMALAFNSLKDSGHIIVACANEHGAKSYESALEKLAGNIASRSKSKCRIFSARNSAAFNSELAKQWIDTALPCRIDSYGLISRPGLFSWNRADTGSSLLLDQLPELSGIGMDLCCGFGLLAEQVMHKQMIREQMVRKQMVRKQMIREQTGVEKIHLVEADILALDCAIRNTQPWQQHILSHWSDATSDPLPSDLDWVVCNPPFHTGQNRDVGLGQSIALRACASLKRGGSLYLVANRKLPYERLLQSELQSCQTLIETNGFKIIKGIR